MADDPSESRNSEYEFPEIPDADQAAQALEQQQPAMDEDLEPIDDLVVMVRAWWSSIVFLFNDDASFRFQEPVNQRLDFNVLMRELETNQRRHIVLTSFSVDSASEFWSRQCGYW